MIRVLGALEPVVKVNKSEQIRELSKKGFSTSEIARTLAVRYQFAYNVLQTSGLLSSSHRMDKGEVQFKPELTRDHLVKGDLIHVSAGSWSTIVVWQFRKMSLSCQVYMRSRWKVAFNT